MSSEKTKANQKNAELHSENNSWSTSVTRDQINFRVNNVAVGNCNCDCGGGVTREQQTSVKQRRKPATI